MDGISVSISVSTSSVVMRGADWVRRRRKVEGIRWAARAVRLCKGFR
jgi:hypothetical protein